jgi:dipeptidyl aminopeptidase/acylaminoacyl peptidase
MRNSIVIFFLLICTALSAQKQSEVTLSIDDFAKWNTISNEIISNDGKIIAFEVNPQKGDGMLFITRCDEGNGFLQVKNKEGSKHGINIPRGTGAKMSPDNNFLVFRIKQPEDIIRKAKLADIKAEKMPKDSLGILILGRDTIFKFPKIKSYEIPEENTKWIAFTVENKDNADTISNSAKKNNFDTDKLVLFEVETSDTLEFNNVTEYFYSKEGDAVYFISKVADSVKTSSTLFLFDTSEGKAVSLFSYEGWMKKIAADKTGEKYSFIMSSDTIDAKIYSLYSGERGEDPRKIIDSYTMGIPVGWSPSVNCSIYFSDDGTKLYLGTAESPEPDPEDTLLEEEIPKVDVWSWQDKKIQPEQLAELEKEKKRTYLAVYHLNKERFIQLADINVARVTPVSKGDGPYALGMDDTPYMRTSSWTGERNSDYYLIDIESGIKREIVDNKSYVQISPNGKYVVWYEPEDSSYYSRSSDINKLETVPLTKMIPVNFFDERNDRPMDPSPYGIAGWSENNRFVYIYDRYDIWKIDPSGERVPVCVTNAYGRRNQTRLRYLKFDNEEEYIPSDSLVVISAFDENTMSAGYMSFNFNAVDDPEMLVMGDYYYNNLKKAKNSDKVIWTKEDVDIFPDIWYSTLDFKDPVKISDANPQQDSYVWPEVKLIRWTGFSGEELKGLLYYPENLDPGKKYPLVLYFYERSSEGLHRHQWPYPSRSTINKAFYVSNGYLVFVPDITYDIGYPGKSAYDDIVSGTLHVINTFPFADKERMGLQGQSWGGYQTAYLVTQTNMFKAAMAGAPVSNMTSAYGGIRWESGMSRMFQYEHQQSRIGGSLWEKPLHYIDNSPLFYAPDINTPLLIMHNDNDGAVPWYQGIELFIALRRLNKPVWLLNYNGEPHNLKSSSWAERIDLSKRMFGFFNHYLKKEDAPEWMIRGVPAIKKGKDFGY